MRTLTGEIKKGGNQGKFERTGKKVLMKGKVQVNENKNSHEYMEMYGMN
jgi:hypothetical protein